MSSLTVSASIKEMFFDRRAVKKRTDRAKHRVLSKAGSHIRKRARTSLRRRKAVSAPGQTPSVHSRDSYATLKNILFGFDGENAVVAGPVGFRTSRKRGVLRSRFMVPELLEGGGMQTLVRQVPLPRTRGRRKSSEKQRAAYRNLVLTGRIQNSAQEVQIEEKVANYEPRPFMGPSLAQERDNFPQLFARSVSS